MPVASRRSPNSPESKVRDLRRALLRWARSSGRHFFWREPGVDPFAVLVCEILLAKTRAELAAPVAQELLARFPTPAALARARPATLERLLFPLGLHRKRSRHLIACARSLRDEFGGVVPRSVPALMQLPFVGRYAANAIACVAFGARVPVIDANVARIYRRVFSLPPPPERLALAHDLWDLAGAMLPRARAKEFNWAVLDLGGTVCTARAPSCDRCPLASLCDDSPARRPSTIGDAT